MDPNRFELQTQLLAWWERCRRLVGGTGGEPTDAEFVSVAGGDGHSLTGEYSAVGGGLQNQVSGDYGGVPSGYGASAYLRGQRSQAAGYLDAVGDCQTSILHLYREVVHPGGGASTYPLFLDGVSVELVLPDDTAWGFSVLLVGKVQGANIAGSWRLEGAIRRGTGAASVLLVGSGVTALGADAGMPAVPVVQANTSVGSLRMVVNSNPNAKTIRWSGRVTLAEVRD